MIQENYGLILGFLGLGLSIWLIVAFPLILPLLLLLTIGFLAWEVFRP